jgi:hypothetical protein
VIAPVLAALGVYDRHCTWPPYASHIMFELWKNARKESFTRSSNDTIRDFYVRVLFNGKDITRHIPACKIAASSARNMENRARFRGAGASSKSRQETTTTDTVYRILTPPPTTTTTTTATEANSKASRRLDELGASTHYSLDKPPPKYRDKSFEKMYDGRNLCSLAAFAKQIDGLLDGAKSMTEACHAGY